MNEKEERQVILIRSKTISRREINEIISQIKNMPSIWKEKFIKDEWQLVFADKMPQKYGESQIYADGNKKQVWINAEVLNMASNVIYIAFVYYIILGYAQIEESAVFAKVVERNKRVLSLFLRFIGRDPSSTKTEIFAELFSFVFETNGETPVSKLDEPYQYVKKWAYGQIFNRNLTYIPNYIEVGMDVIDEQIEMTDKAFKSLPQKLQQQFLKEKWKIRISNERILEDSIYGICSSFHRRIFIRSSSINLIKTIWHEFGHYLDFKESILSHREFFKTIFNRERMSIRILYDRNANFKYAISNSEEYFADIFALYMMDPDALKKCAYESFNIISEVVKRWK